MSGALDKQIGVAVTDDMKQAIEELAHERRMTTSQLMRKVVADECERAPEVDVERNGEECVHPENPTT